MSETKTWFITGTSRGFGHLWAEAALARGDRVAATARDVHTLDPLVEAYGEAILPLTLDITDKAAVDTAIDSAHNHFGGLDIVVNNAGGGLLGTVEEAGEDEVRQVIDTNFFGPLWVTKAAVPLLRRQGGGHIVQVSSIGGVQAFPGAGFYNASKWALEAFSQSLAGEVASFGVKVTLIEPIGYATEWVASAAKTTPMTEYDEMRAAHSQSLLRTRRGDPAATAAALLEVVDAEEPPLRVFFGDWAFEAIAEEYAERLRVWERWDELAHRAHGGDTD
jgi:NAD(P)-dependent dehydrogenase (short-subunit alcohol dehydrogenase family)